MQNLILENLSKAYGGVPALQNVTLNLQGGRVHALMGENGAGKSTLIKLIAGVVSADTLGVVKDGQRIPLHSATDAHNAGFRFIHQELNIVPQVSVAENILLGRRYPRRFGLAINWKKVRQQAQAALDFLGAGHINVNTQAGALPAGDKMLVRIAAALVAEDEAWVGGSDNDLDNTSNGTAISDRQVIEAELYVLDEPTAALTNDESAMLFTVIERLKNKGAAVLYVSHRLDEVLRLCDDISILRDGMHVSTGPLADTNKNDIIRAMTGRSVRDAYPPRDSAIAEQQTLCVTDAGTATLGGLNFNLRRGEILGISGLAEAGQTQVLRLFMGLERLVCGQATLAGDDLPRNPTEAWERGVAYIPRERRSESLMLDLPIRANVVLPHLGEYGFKANKRGETAKANALAAKVRLKFDSLEQTVGQLSGGNQQKVVFARALYGNPKLLLLDEPTRGVDVGAKYDIYLLVRELSAQGCSVILTSTDLPEVLGMCDRILVLQQGRQAHLLDCGALSSADLLATFYDSPNNNPGNNPGNNLNINANSNTIDQQAT